ncbi:hypothetical protein SBRY_60254 [Actinacidiphila bryophytorum]|uniref:Uncharacterized protein n=1 Tax=Actinacidiphila bryophytorum TaxID=1436133 RepID=A0A9W4H676_9ACTN|nr:hypothetical protein SBRY_60254 [Actinacidiphila bryophytorum]
MQATQFPNPVRTPRTGAPVNLGSWHHDPDTSGAAHRGRGRGHRLAGPGRQSMARPVLPHLGKRLVDPPRGPRRRHDLHGDVLHPAPQPAAAVRPGRKRPQTRPRGTDHRDRAGRRRLHPADGLLRQGAARPRRRTQRRRRHLHAGRAQHDLAAGHGHVCDLRRGHRAAGRHRAARDRHERDTARAQTRHHHRHRALHRDDRPGQRRLRRQG